ncbi:MAG TPA: hypothetical protein VIB38_12395 [Aestuariivirgaceae bacterium]|jgi:hypothetical protein
MMRGVYAQIAMFALLALLLSAVVLGLLLKPIQTAAIEPKEPPFQLSFPPLAAFPPENASMNLAPILARPLFFESRRPFEAPAAKVEIAPQPAEPPIPIIAVETLMLKGILLGSGSSKALIASPANPSGIWVAVGAEIEGWKIEVITRADVRLVQQQQRAVLPLYRRDASR